MDAEGRNSVEIGRLMKRDSKQVGFRIRKLLRLRDGFEG